MTLSGPLSYLIGADADAIKPDFTHIIELPYDASLDAVHRLQAAHTAGLIKYGNLLDEEYTNGVYGSRRRYGPYAKDQSGTPEDWGEGRIDTGGVGWTRYLNDQFQRCKQAGIFVMEWDNADSYHFADVQDALDRSQSAGIQVVAKNPQICENAHAYVGHPNVKGAIVEAHSGTCDGMQLLRVQCNKVDMPVWFVSNRSERSWAIARRDIIKIKGYKNMGVTWCPSSDDYSTSTDLLVPV